MPTADGYDAATASTPNALKVVASGATAGQINLADVKKASFYPANVKADDYVVAATEYTTYVLGNQFFDYDNVGVKVPNEMARDPKTNGGVDTLYTRQRKLFVPKWISFTKASMQTNSPTPAELANGANWEVVNNGKSGSQKAYVNHKMIPVVQIISRG